MWVRFKRILQVLTIRCGLVYVRRGELLGLIRMRNTCTNGHGGRWSPMYISDAHKQFVHMQSVEVDKAVCRWNLTPPAYAQLWAASILRALTLAKSCPPPVAIHNCLEVMLRLVHLATSFYPTGETPHNYEAQRLNGGHCITEIVIILCKRGSLIFVLLIAHDNLTLKENMNKCMMKKINQSCNSQKNTCTKHSVELYHIYSFMSLFFSAFLYNIIKALHNIFCCAPGTSMSVIIYIYKTLDRLLR